MEEIRYQKEYSQILREEIVPATGCTEPISIAYCAAKAHQVLGMQPTAVTVSVSGNILKNVKSVVVPNTNGLKGIRAAVAAGIVCGDADKGMQVISRVTEEQRASVAHFMDTVNIDVSCAETDCPLYISITLYARTSYSRVVIANNHSNIVEIMKNGEAILKHPIVAQSEDNLTDKSCLNLHDVFHYADKVDISEVQDLLDLQIDYNMAICEEGLSDCVELLGAMKPEQVRAHMEKSSVFLFTSDFEEGWGAVLNEAMNSGCAVIASHAIGAAPYLVKDGENGLLYRNGDMEDLYCKVVDLLTNPERQRQLGEKAYYTMVSCWNPQEAARRLIKLAQSICSGDSKPEIFQEGPGSRAPILKNDWYA